MLGETKGSLTGVLNDRTVVPDSERAAARLEKSVNAIGERQGVYRFGNELTSARQQSANRPRTCVVGWDFCGVGPREDRPGSAQGPNGACLDVSETLKKPLWRSQRCVVKNDIHRFLVIGVRIGDE